MTIFLLTRNFPSVICGVGDYTYELYQRLSSRGYQVKVITSVSEDVERFVQERRLDGDVYPVISEWNYSCIKKIIFLLKENKADWFCVQYVPYSYSRIGFPFFIILLQLRVKMNKIKTAVFFHEVSVRPFLHGVKAFLRGIAQRFISYSLFALSDFSFTNNILYQPFFAPFDIPVVPIPANLYGETETRVEKKLPSSKIKITSFINRSGKDVIEAVAQCIHLDKLNIEFTIVGTGLKDVQQNVENFVLLNHISENVFLSDKRSRAEIARTLYDSDIFLNLEYVDRNGEGGISSKSGVTAAAMAAGLPIIGSFGDMTDASLYKDGENIVLLKNPTVQSIRNSIKKLYSDESLRNHLAANAVKTYQSSFSWDNTVASYVTKFEN